MVPDEDRRFLMVLARQAAGEYREDVPRAEAVALAHVYEAELYRIMGNVVSDVLDVAATALRADYLPSQPL